MPFDFSVICANANEGFYFANGELLLSGRKLYLDVFQSRGPLFFLFYAALVKIFGFGTYAIIAAHIIHKIVIVLAGVALYLLTNELLSSKFFAGLAVLFLVLLLLTPIGQWGALAEFESNLGLEAEYFSVVFSLFALYFLAISCKGIKTIFFSIMGGVLTVCSMMFKANGAILAIAVFVWILYIFLFDREAFKELKRTIIFFMSGLVFTLLIFIVGIYLHTNDLGRFFDVYFFTGNYNNEAINSIQNFLMLILRFMLRYCLSLNNFLLFLFTFMFFGWSLVRKYFIKTNTSILRAFIPLLSLCGIGNCCVVMAPGFNAYGSYYYLLVWPFVAIALTFSLKEIFTYATKPGLAIFKIGITIIFIILFAERIYITFPGYFKLAKINILLNPVFQAESFQDPVVYSQNINERRRFLFFADVINSFLPDKNDKIYIFNDFTNANPLLSANIYIYTKRGSASSIFSNWFYLEKFFSKTMPLLIKDLSTVKPKIIIVPCNPNLQLWTAKPLAPYFRFFDLFLKENYHLISTLKYESEDKSYDVFERK